MCKVFYVQSRNEGGGGGEREQTTAKEILSVFELVQSYFDL